MNLRVELFVKDPDRSVNFYTNVLGFTALKSHKDYFPVQRDNIIIGIGTIKGLDKNHYFRPEIKNQRLGLGVEIVLEVDDIEEMYRKVKATGYKIERALGKREWGLSDFRVVDPDGYYIRVTSRK